MIGTMVRAGTSAPMKVVDVTNGVAECIFIDGNGCIRHRHHDASSLVPMWMSLGPKSLWPEITQLDLIAIEKEEAEAKASRKAAKKAAQKAKRSKRIKR